MTNGWAIVHNGEIDIDTVSGTRRAAIINWLCRKCMIFNHESDEVIESKWKNIHDPTYTSVVQVILHENLGETVGERNALK